MEKGESLTEEEYHKIENEIKKLGENNKRRTK